ncbi:MAG: virulence-associated E family protein, partial [Parasphingorhabdus sp.]
MTAEVMDLRAWRGNVDENNGKPLKTMKNLMVYLANVRALGDQIRHNELTGNIEWDGEPITDTDLIDIRVILESEEPPCEFATQDLYPAIQRHAKENTYHPIRDYLGSLKWDKKPRLDKWLISALGAENTAFNQAVARRSLISAVARAYEPGCKVDTVLVLEGPQGVRKSTAVATLFGPEYTAESVSLFDQHNKMVMAMKGHWVVELAEFVAFFKKDKSAVKGMISMRSDNVVLPYAKMASNHPRQCIFIGTINPGNFGYLTDDENRRYWPVTVGKCDTDLLLEHRDQIWAEAVAAYRNNEQ